MEAEYQANPPPRDRVTPADGPNIPAVNFRITDELALGQGSEAVKFRDNIAAIETVKQIVEYSVRYGCWPQISRAVGTRAACR